MTKAFRFCDFLVILCFDGLLASHKTVKDHDVNNKFIFKVCNQTVAISKQYLMHIVNFNKDHDITPILQLFHENSISTRLIDDIDELKRFTESTSCLKNVLLFVNDLDDILNLVMNSLRNDKKNGEYFANRSSVSTRIYQNITSKQRCPDRLDSASKWHKYCFSHEQIEETLTGSSTTMCETILSITDEHFKSNSKLPDQLFNLIRGIAQHRIWNSQNYLIFALWNPGTKIITTDSKEFEDAPFSNSVKRIYGYYAAEEKILLFIFKFFWRFFKGHKAIICRMELSCYRYDPFRKTIEHYTEKSSNYFDFTWTSMNGESMGIVLYDYFDMDFQFNYHYWRNVIVDMASLAAEKEGASIDLSFIKADRMKRLDFDLSLKYGSDIFLTTRDLAQAEIANFDVTTSIDSAKACFILPREHFMPQSLVPLVSFTASVWIAVLLTFTIFLIVHHTYKNILQMEVFQHHVLRNQTALTEVSTFFSVFSYFLCISPSHSVLDRLRAGKMLIVTFSFTAMILATAFLSQMMTLLNKRVRYADMNTLKQLQESDYIFEALAQQESLVMDILMGDPDKYEWLNGRFISSFQNALSAHEQSVSEEIVGVFSGTKWTTFNENEECSEETFRNTVEVINSVMKTNGFILTLPSRFLNDGGFFWLENPLDTFGTPKQEFHSLQEWEFHSLQECIMSYPVMYMMVKYSPYAEKFNDFILRMVEAGISSRDMALSFDAYRLVRVKNETDDDVRSFGIVDLQFAFIVLIFGLGLSSFVFIEELFMTFVKKPERGRTHRLSCPP